MKIRAWFTLVLSALTLTIPAQPQAESGFGEAMTITEVEIPVQVFADGEPVGGLTENDFEVYDNGERRELAAFEVVDLSVGSPQESATAAETGPEGAHRTLLLMFDLAFNHPRKLARAVKGTERMLKEQLHPRDQVAVATFDLGRGVTLLSGFTTDRGESLDALARLDRMIGGETLEIGPLGMVMARARSSSAPAPASSVTELSQQLGAAAALALEGHSPSFRPPARSLAQSGEAADLAGSEEDPEPRQGRAAQRQRDFGADERTRQDNPSSQVGASTVAELADSFADDAAQRQAVQATRAATEAFSEIATLFRNLPGEKQMFYLSRGLPNVSASSQRVAQLMEEMFRAFKASGWTLQALDISGVPDPFGGAEMGGETPSTVGFISDSLVNAAKGTGGDVYENFNDLSQATARVMERTRITYLLTFAVADAPEDGRYHRLDVRLKNRKRGYQLVHREGYYNKKPVAERSVLERRLDFAEEVLGEGEGGDFTAHSWVATLAAGQSPGQVWVWVEVPGGELSGGRREGKVNARLEAYLLDDNDRFADSLVGQVELDLAAVGERLDNGNLRVVAPLAASAGEHRLRLRLVEGDGGRSWLGTVRVAVPQSSQLPRLLPPLFPDLQPAGVVTRLGKANDVSKIFRFGDRELVPRAAPSCRAGERLPVLLLIEGKSSGGFAAQLLDANGKAVAGERLAWLSREESGEDGIERILGTLDCSGLAPGVVQLEVRLGTGTPEKAASVTRSEFEVLPATL